jgi:hypothetical protein
MKRIILLTLISGIIMFRGYSQSPASLDDYETICFCSVKMTHPESILRMDNNREILFGLGKGKTLNELRREGINYTHSQIVLMESSGLIGRKDSLYMTNIPVLSQNYSGKLREQSLRMAGEIIPLFKDDFDDFVNVLNSKELQKNCYSIFFAYIIDGMVWDILYKRDQIEGWNITKENPFWGGTFWMIEPKRSFYCGTNSFSSGDYTLKVNWSRMSGVRVSDYDMLTVMLDDYSEHGKVTRPEIFQEFRENNLFDNKGEMTIPVIYTESDDPIYNLTKRISEEVADYLVTDIDYSRVLPDYPALTVGQKTTILYHEIMWDILDIMVDKGYLKKPIAFGKPANAKQGDLRDLIFLVKN